MANKEETVTDILQELKKNKFAKSALDKWSEHAKSNRQVTFLLVLAILITMLILNWCGKMTTESNGWLLAALIGYLFGRSR